MNTSVERYESLYREDAPARERAYRDLVVRYYDLVTDFYERGWGESFHFAPRYDGETFEVSLLRHELHLALRLGLEAGMRVLDVGCGVGGPMRAIARATGASIEGVNTNVEQLARVERYAERAGLSAFCRGVEGDFMNLPMEDARYDAAYAIEATCHAPDRRGVFGQVARVLRPGGKLAGYEWVLTRRFDEGDAHHRELAHRICAGNGLPKLTHEDDVRDALVHAGFHAIEIRDVADEGNPVGPWYEPLEGKGRTPARFPRHPLLKPVIPRALRIAERVRLVPEGTWRVSRLLHDGGDALVEAGRLGIFTPCLFFLATKADLP